jgi:hypothetical protein
VVNSDSFHKERDAEPTCSKQVSLAPVLFIGQPEFDK